MPVSSRRLSVVVLTCLLVSPHIGHAQERMPATDPPSPQGVEVLARGPVHEAFASPMTEPVPTQSVPKRPPRPLEELPPQEKPEGQVIWIGGYWAWDDERKDYLWVSGTWRTPPPHKQWIAGYWREQGEQWQWVPGFWTDAAEEAGAEGQQVTYLPKPPDPPQVAPPGPQPVADSFYVPGSWIWNPAAGSYAWRAGYWARVQPGYVWVPNRYLWTPTGYVFIPGYWDYAVGQRGVLYAPVIVDSNVMPAGFYYTPTYAVSDTVVVDALFVRPMYAHYYFGDYYGPAYATMGYQSAFVYSGRNYDSIIVYERWAHRSQPNWVSVQIDVFNGRSRGVLPVPPRTLVQQNTIIQRNITNVTNVTNNVTNNTTNINRKYATPVLASTSKVVAAKGGKTVALDEGTRVQAKQQAAAVQQVALQRTVTEKPLPPGAPRQARVASLNVPKTQAVHPGFVAPHVTPQATNQAQAGQAIRPASATVAAPQHPALNPQGAMSPMGHFGPGGMTTAPQPRAPVGVHPLPPASPGQPPHVAPKAPPARPAQPPARRPPPKETKEHHG